MTFDIKNITVGSISTAIAKAKVIGKAAVTYLTALAVIVGIFAEEIGSVLPAGAAEEVGSIAAVVVAWLGAAIAIIRRVTPVLPEERGVLPQDDSSE